MCSRRELGNDAICLHADALFFLRASLLLIQENEEEEEEEEEGEDDAYEEEDIPRHFGFESPEAPWSPPQPTAVLSPPVGNVGGAIGSAVRHPRDLPTEDAAVSGSTGQRRGTAGFSRLRNLASSLAGPRSGQSSQAAQVPEADRAQKPRGKLGLASVFGKVAKKTPL